jgi:hypothetical protein
MANTFDSPVLADDLKAGERWFTRDHPGDNQGLGHDLTVRRKTGGNSWTCWKAGTDGKKNEDSLAWNKPVYAMQDAVVERSWRNAPDNPAPGDKLSNIGGQPGDVPSGGNHLLVRNSDGGLLLYAHFRKGTVSTALCPEDAELLQPGQEKGFEFDPDDRPTIKKGQLLGRVGNSGKSTGPHLHIHRLDADSKPKALPLSRGMVSDFTKSGSGDCSGTADINRWTRLDGDPIPQARVLFWPPRRLRAEYTRHGFASSDFQRMFSHLADSGFWLDWINGYSVAGKVFYNHIWKPAEGPWRAYSSLKQSEVKKKLDEAKADGFGPVHLDSYLRSGSVRYAIIFHKNKPGWRVRTDRSPAQHQDIFDEAKKDGLRPAAISVVSIGGERRYSALYRKISGSRSAKSTIPESDYQTVFDENVAAGRIPVYLKAYMHNGSPFVSAIFSSNPSGPFKARHGMSSSSLQSDFDAAMSAGFRTKVITAFDGAQSQHRYFAVWRK